MDWEGAVVADVGWEGGRCGRGDPRGERCRSATLTPCLPVPPSRPQFPSQAGGDVSAAAGLRVLPVRGCVSVGCGVNGAAAGAAVSAGCVRGGRRLAVQRPPSQPCGCPSASNPCCFLRGLECEGLREKESLVDT